jgi:hypothetical protein
MQVLWVSKGENKLAAYSADTTPDLGKTHDRGFRDAHERIHQNGKTGSSDGCHDVSDFASQIEVRQTTFYRIKEKLSARMFSR